MRGASPGPCMLATKGKYVFNDEEVSFLVGSLVFIEVGKALVFRQCAKLASQLDVNQD